MLRNTSTFQRRRLQKIRRFQYFITMRLQSDVFIDYIVANRFLFGEEKSPEIETPKF